jgi:hypothetical protein
MIHDTKPGKAKIGPAQTLQVNSGLLGVRVGYRNASRWGDKRVTYRGRGCSKLEEQPLTIWQIGNCPKISTNVKKITPKTATFKPLLWQFDETSRWFF